MINTKRTFFKLIGAIGFCLLSNLTLATPLHITLDTSNFSGTGWLDLQFNPGLVGSPTATASLSHFSGTIDNNLTAYIDGDVTGTLPGNLLFTNSSSFNDVFQPILMGGSFSFDLLLESILQPSNSSTIFSLALYGADMSTALGKADPFTNSLLTFELASELTTNINDTLLVKITKVPEPQAWLLLLLGIALIAVRKKSILQ